MTPDEQVYWMIGARMRGADGARLLCQDVGFDTTLAARLSEWLARRDYPDIDASVEGEVRAWALDHGAALCPGAPSEALAAADGIVVFVLGEPGTANAPESLDLAVEEAVPLALSVFPQDVGPVEVSESPAASDLRFQLPVESLRNEFAESRQFRLPGSLPSQGPGG